MQGAWLEPRINAMWQENAGATPTTSGGQTIGLMLGLDRQAQLGPELVTNGDFSGGTTGFTAYAGASLSTSNAQLAMTAPAGGTTFWTTTITTVVGRTYKVSSELISFSGSVALVRFSKADNANISTNEVFGAASQANPGTASFAFIATATTTYICMRMYTGNGSATVDNISVREIIGNHASQATAANRPTLQYANGLPFVRCDSNDFMTVYLPNLGSGVFSSSGSVYFALNTGMSALHNQSIGTSYSAPIQSMDLYGVVIVPSRLSDQRETQLQTYFEKLAGLR